MEQTKRLYRSRTNRIIGGVSAGLGEYFGIDPVIIRILFVLMTLGHGFGVPLYILLWIVIPEEPLATDRVDHDKTDKKTDKEDLGDRVEKVASEVREKIQHLDREDARSGRNTGGVILVLIGLFLLFGNLFSYDFLGKLWPLILVIIGLVILTRRSDTKGKE